METDFTEEQWKEWTDRLGNLVLISKAKNAAQGRLDYTADRWPQFLPRGAAVLFTASSRAVGMESARIEVFVFKTGETRIVQRGAYYGRYQTSGHLVYVRQGAFMQ